MKVHDLEPGDLLQFTPNAGPVSDLISEGPRTDAWGDTIKIEAHFNWVWEHELTPRHMIYIGRKRTNGVLSYEVLWNNKPRLIKGKYLRHLERVVGSENIQADERASKPPNVEKSSVKNAARTGPAGFITCSR